MKPDEIQLLIALLEHQGGAYNPNQATARDLINNAPFPIHYKRCWYLLGKWTKKGWYDYGVTLDLGWLTPQGVAVAQTQSSTSSNSSSSGTS